MRQDKFEMRRAEVMLAVKDMPASIKEKYLLSENMSKDDAIMAIYLLDKKRLYEIIDAAPDAMLARLFKEHDAALGRNGHPVAVGIHQLRPLHPGP